MRNKRKLNVDNVIKQMDTFGELLKLGKEKEAIEQFIKLEQYILNEVYEATGKTVHIPPDYKCSPEDMFWYWLEEL